MLTSPRQGPPIVLPPSSFPFRVLLLPFLHRHASFLTSSNIFLRTVIHGDYKISNLFIDNAIGKVYSIDWQWVGGGSPVTDVAYLLCTSLQFEQVFDDSHKEAQGNYAFLDLPELKLLQAYHDSLTGTSLSSPLPSPSSSPSPSPAPSPISNFLAAGITNYSFPLFIQQYLLNVIYFFVFAVRAKYARMTPKDIQEYREQSKDGLHLRSLAQIKKFAERAARFLPALDKKLLDANVLS